MIIRFINEGTFRSYKDKLSKEDKIKRIKTETRKIIRKEEIKQLIPIFQEAISYGIKENLRIKRKLDSHTVLHFKLENKVEPVWGEEDNQEYIVKPILEFEDNETLLVKIPMYFNELGELIFIASSTVNEDYAYSFKKYYFGKNEKLQEALQEVGIKNLNVQITLENYNIEEDIVRLNHFGNIDILDKFFAQFDGPVHINARSFETYCAFGYHENLDEYNDLAKYFSADDQVIVTVSNPELKDIDDVMAVFSKNGGRSIMIRLSLKDCKSYGPNPSKKPITDEFLEKYFGKTYKEIIEENAIEEFGRKNPWESRLTSIEFFTDKSYNIDQIKESAHFYCTKY